MASKKKETTKNNVGNTAPTDGIEAPIGTHAVAQQAPTSHVGMPVNGANDFEGEMEKSDIKIPKLNIAQKIGPLSDDWPFGAWVLSRTTQLAGLGDPVHFTPLSGRKTYVEALEYGSDTFPRVFNTKAEALNAGLRVEFDSASGDRPEVNQCLDVVLLIRSTDADSPEFALEFNGEKYAMALWTIGSWSAYNAAAKPLLTARTMHLTSFHQREWTAITTKHVLGNGNTIANPKLTAGVENNVEFKAWADSLVS